MRFTIVQTPSERYLAIGTEQERRQMYRQMRQRIWRKIPNFYYPGSLRFIGDYDILDDGDVERDDVVRVFGMLHDEI